MGIGWLFSHGSVDGVDYYVVEGDILAMRFGRACFRHDLLLGDDLVNLQGSYCGKFVG